jgi:hypothetical protein
VLVVPPSRDRRDRASWERSSDESWNRRPKRPILSLVAIVAFCTGLIAFGFWGGVIAFACVPIGSGFVTGTLRARSELRSIQPERESTARIASPPGVGERSAAVTERALRGARLARALRKQNDVDGLLELLPGSDRFARYGAAWHLSELGVAQAVDPLMRCLGDSDDLVRMSFLKALGRLGDPRASNAVFHVAINDREFGVRCSAAEALVELHDPRSVEAFQLLLDEFTRNPRLATGSSNRFIKWACERLIELKGSQALPQLIQATTSAGIRDGRRLRATIASLESPDDSS